MNEDMLKLAGIINENAPYGNTRTDHQQELIEINSKFIQCMDIINVTAQGLKAYRYKPDQTKTERMNSAIMDLDKALEILGQIKEKIFRN